MALRDPRSRAAGADHTRFMTALEHYTLGAVICARPAHTELARLTAVEPAGYRRRRSGQLHLPLGAAGGPLELDLLWPDLSRRVQVNWNDGAGALLELRSPDRTLEQLTRFDRRHVHLRSFTGRDALTDALERLIAAHPAGSDHALTGALIMPEGYDGQLLCTDAFADINPVRFTSDPAGHTMRVLCQFAPPVADTAIAWMTDGWEYELDYDTVEALAARAEALHIDPEGMDVTALREAIATMAIGRHPAARLVDGACFVRAASDPGDGQPAQQLELDSLESLTCHALGRRFVCGAIDPQPSRLKATLSPLETFVPLSPYTRG